MRATLAALSLSALSCASAPPVVPAPTGALLYAADGEGGDPTVHRVNADGRQDAALTVCRSAGFPGPADPRGELALVVCASGMAEVAHLEQLRVVPLAGGPAIDLGPPARTVRNPTWAPDGGWIVFESDVASFRDLYRVSRDGAELKRLTDEPAGNFEPSVDPTGSRLAFISSRDGNAEVYTSGVDGGELVRVTNDPADDMRPAWSPDGKTLAFLSMRGGAQRVWRVGADGVDPKPLVAAGVEVHTELAWAPDGSAIAVTVAPGPKQTRVDVVRLDGTVEASFGAPDKVSYPAWSADSAWLALSVDGSDGADVVIATRDGKTRKRVTTAKGADWLPRWLVAPK
jgi:Tol biopolymer transport system component